MIYVIKAKLASGIHYVPDMEVSRTIRIGGSVTLAELADYLLGTFDFDRDHLYHFSVGRFAYDPPLYCLNPSRREDKSVKEKLYRLNLRKNQVFYFVFDYGDEWHFDLTVLDVQDASGNIAPSVLESIGKAEQYPDYEDCEEETEDDGDDCGDGNPEEAEKWDWLKNWDYSPDEIQIQGLPGGGDWDIDEEYFEDTKITTDYNPRLGRILLRVIERQIEMKSPEFIEQAWHELQIKGYFRKFAKQKLAMALVSELYEIMKYHKSYSEERYRSFVEETLRESFDEDSVLDFETGREHILSEQIYYITDLSWEGKKQEAAQEFVHTWPMVAAWLEQNYTRETENGLMRYTAEQIDEAMDFRLDLFGLVDDADRILLNGGDYENAIPVFESILETFSWIGQEAGKARLRGAIAECMDKAGHPEEADQYYEEWMNQEPDNIYLINPYVMLLQDRGDIDKARTVLETGLKKVGGRKANSKAFDEDGLLSLYTRAKEFYRETEDFPKQSYYAGLADSVKHSMENTDFFSLYSPSENYPVKNAGKIYPNDPCPCGSGKKYKKCCGKL